MDIDDDDGDGLKLSYQHSNYVNFELRRYPQVIPKLNHTYVSK